MAAAIVFPASLPPVDPDEYTDSQEESRSTFRPDIGSTRTRRLFTTTPRIFDVSWNLSAAQYAVIKAWFEQSTNRGEREFDIPLIDTTEDLLSWFTVNWISNFKSVCYNGMRWRVSATLRSIKEPFTERAPGTDELCGLSDLVFSNTGEILVEVALYGSSAVTFENSGRMTEGAMFGASSLEFNNSGRFFNFGVLWGDQYTEFDNSGDLLTNSRRITHSGPRVVNGGEKRKVN